MMKLPLILLKSVNFQEESFVYQSMANLSYKGTGQMVQWLRTLAVLLEDLGLIPSTNMEVTTTCNSRPRQPNTLVWPSWVWLDHGAQITCRQKLPYTQDKNKGKEEEREQKEFNGS